MVKKDGTDVFKTGRKDEVSEGRWERVVERQLRSSGYPSRDRIFASSAGLCERQTAGLMMLSDGHEDKRRASTQFYFKIGSAIEEVVERALKRSGLWLDSEFRVESMYDELPLSGRVDFVAEDPLSGEPTLVELKTCGKLPKAPRHSHYAQLMTYLILTGMPSGIVWYVSRSVSDYTGDVKQVVFEVTPTDDERRFVATRISRGAVFGAVGAIPDLPKHMKKYKCGFCPLIPMCWDGEDLGLSGHEPTPDEKIELIAHADGLCEMMIDDQGMLRAMFIEELNS